MFKYIAHSNFCVKYSPLISSYWKKKCTGTWMSWFFFKYHFPWSGVSIFHPQLMWFNGKKRLGKGLVSKNVNYTHKILHVGLQNYHFLGLNMPKIEFLRLTEKVVILNTTALDHILVEDGHSDMGIFVCCWSKEEKNLRGRKLGGFSSTVQLIFPINWVNQPKVPNLTHLLNKRAPT